MSSKIILQGRELAVGDIEFIGRLIDDNPTWSRRRISQAVCKAWDWKNGVGLLKDMACRSLLLKLEGRGLVRLPVRRQIPTNRMAQKRAEWVKHETTPIVGALSALQVVQVKLVKPGSDEAALWSCLLSNYHYLGYTGSVGENLKYLVTDRQDRALACLLFGSTAWSVKGRDAFIGWDAQRRRCNLFRVTNNTRFLILPWVQVPHLASHLLGLVSRRIRQDWQERYGHSIELIETFVEKRRFQGTCYRAANWINVGDTQGRSRNDRHRDLSVPVKAVYVYPLTRDFRARLNGG